MLYSRSETTRPTNHALLAQQASSPSELHVAKKSINRGCDKDQNTLLNRKNLIEIHMKVKAYSEC